jgi:hypothetical protein
VSGRDDLIDLVQNFVIETNLRTGEQVKLLALE